MFAHSATRAAGFAVPAVVSARERVAGAVIQPSRIDELLSELRGQYQRVQPKDLAACIRDGALVIDTRPIEQRERDGDLPGAIVVDRNVLEWRLDPTSSHRIPEATHGRRVVIVCNEGYSSTLAAMSLRALGLSDATDVVDGFQGLMRAGVIAPAHKNCAESVPSACGA